MCRKWDQKGVEARSYTKCVYDHVQKTDKSKTKLNAKIKVTPINLLVTGIRQGSA